MSTTPYEALCKLARERALISTTAAVLGWDQETFLPPKAVDYRARQLGWLSGKAHELATSSEWERALAEAEAEDSTNALESANLREFRHHYDRSAKLSRELVELETRTSSRAKAAWMQARKESNFSLFAPDLETLLDIARQKADLWGFREEPYDALLEEYERGSTTAEVADLFNSCRDAIIEIAREAVENSSATPANLLEG
ncbi:MAG TPA: carboxypeptidase, partial [Verrucomicrobiales bacterium]|nr:carboxypeptidase [Verrucomicrobiales bacterium]